MNLTYYYLLGLTFVLATPFNLSAAPSGTTMEREMRAVKEHYLPGVKRRAGAMEEKVNELLDERTDATRWKNFHGSHPGEIVQKWEEDIEYMTGGKFNECQGPNPSHSYAQMLFPPYTTPTMCGGEWYHYVGQPSGVAIRAESTGNIFCPCRYIVADVVEYFHPTAKLDASQQMYQSMYLDEDIVTGLFIPGNQALLNPAFTTLNTSLSATKARHLANTTLTVTLGEEPMDESKVINADREFAQKLDEFTSSELGVEMIHTSTNSQHVYTRNLFEFINLMTNAFWWIPHQAKFHFFGSDFPQGVAFSKFLFVAETLAGTDLGDKDASFSQAGAQLACIKNNKALNKTPTDLFPPDSIIHMQTTAARDELLCLKNVGQRYPVVSQGLLEVTDQTYRGVAKDLDLFYSLVEQGIIPEAHTYKEDIDKLLVLRNDALKNENPECKKLEDMPKINRQYESSNVKDPRTGAENTFEMFTVFRGAWGFKGTDENYFVSAGCPGGGVYLFGSQALPSSPKFRLE